eukprot:12422538-Karenia_brevis.AAC.1
MPRKEHSGKPNTLSIVNSCTALFSTIGISIMRKAGDNPCRIVDINVQKGNTTKNVNVDKASRR